MLVSEVSDTMTHGCVPGLMECMDTLVSLSHILDCCPIMLGKKVSRTGKTWRGCVEMRVESVRLCGGGGGGKRN